MVVTGWAGYRSTERLLDASGWVSHTYVVIGDADALRIDLLMLENGSRGYIATGDPTFLDPAESLRTRLAQHRAMLKTLTADNPEQQRQLDFLNPLIDAGLAEMTQ